MTQKFFFVPSQVSAPSFQATLDGHLHSVSVTWNVSSQRYFINVYNSSATLVCSVPLSPSPRGTMLAALSWDENQRVAVATLQRAFWRPVGQIVRYTIEGCMPDTYNGQFDCLTLSETQFTYPMPARPTETKVLGAASRFINMVAPFFKTSSLIFRGHSFEVIP